MPKPITRSWGAGQAQLVVAAAFAFLSFFSVATTLSGQNAIDSSSSATDNRAAQSQVGTGQQVELEGELEIMYQDDFKGGRSKLLYSLKKSDGTHVPLKFADAPPTNHLSGDHVRVSGQMSGGSLILYSSNTKTSGSGGGGTTTSGDATGSTTSTSIPVPYTFGAQSTLVILLNFQDETTQPYAVADAQNMFFGTANNFFLENSYGQTSITGDVVGWYTIPLSVTTCDTSQIAAAAQSAATGAGVNLANYARYVYAFPQNNVCGFAGASYVGGNPSQGWINGNSLEIRIVDHELGHALGLWHSHLFDCGTAATIGSSCSIDEYGDILDTMGAIAPWSAHYNAFQKERLGWLNYGASPSIQTVTAAGSYTIYPYELGGPGPNALKIFKGNDPTTGAKVWYYLEQRQSIGFDAFLTDGTCEQCYTQNETTGVLFHIGTDGNGNTSDLLDMTPATPTYEWAFDPSLAIGQSFTDSTAGVTFTTESVTSAGGIIDVEFSGSGNAGSGSQSGTPALTMATNQGAYAPGQTVSITATAMAGSSPLANVSVSFSVTNPNGSKMAGSANTGKNGVAVYKLKLKSNAPAGNYTAGSAATIQGSALSTTAPFAVQ